MKAMVLNRVCKLKENKNPLELIDLPDPIPGEKEILVKVSACGICHTELDEIEGRTPPPRLPIIPGHQVVGRVEKTCSKTRNCKMGDRVGIAWIHSACGKCKFCREGNENLCDDFRATGRDANGGYAQYITVLEDFVYRIPEIFSDSEAAPLLCAGAIGYRSLRLANMKDGQNLGLTGFGASAHLVMKMARYKYPNSKVFVFARSERERTFAKELGAVWAGDIEEESPGKLDCIIDTTPVWKPIVEALGNLERGGRLVINAIRKEEVDKESLLKLKYSTHLWLEKEIKSVANVSRSDVNEFLSLAAEIPIKPEVQEFALKEANKALVELKEGKIRGAKVLRID
ncbi:MAG: alcohol dehydrogenase [Candidatus Brocadia sp. AMX2]|uniref:Zinc-binding alcohol dehydrogenase family protein n=1 Tax=Candidatus Brocadia sinica JPN1 TaxID=1197129 RepID=A0ABQ0JXQ9_9BACT|nr:MULTISPECIES: zinc-dependent alcohol dehydrogenase family protein [Brocadia]KXK30346.1 MAG: sorbitol dehydrogenase [Candidatus Brocadia sinica]MBC6931074.1 alcohol dehydrogenase [Candidatus Brocadia sp.]MBL1168149.1 alcohol dehydrogenase [Candidatus Brocadia sp. AMX1]NOG40921.1 zinc-dependent alcohol dehydrogenase family protein [Planctomycetota bacterium]MCE7865749.1 alcohol dehydrogenase [Candidatus Brocadia sp. AMX2]